LAQTRPPQANAVSSPKRLFGRTHRQVTVYRVLRERGAEKDLLRLTLRTVWESTLGIL
jgi:hypothetical protein